MEIKCLRSSDGWADESTRMAESCGSLILELKTNDLRSHGSLSPGGWASLPRGLRLLMSAMWWLGLSGVLVLTRRSAQVSRTCFPKEVVIVRSERLATGDGFMGVCVCRFRHMFMFHVCVYVSGICSSHYVYVCTENMGNNPVSPNRLYFCSSVDAQSESLSCIHCPVSGFLSFLFLFGGGPVRKGLIEWRILINFLLNETTGDWNIFEFPQKNDCNLEYY